VTGPGLPQGFFRRADEGPDDAFYATPRLVLHLDDVAVAAVTALYDELGVADGDVLDLMSSWVSHLPRRPRSLTVLGMNAAELDANPVADAQVVHDSTPTLGCRSPTRASMQSSTA
jgi:hypothetical protein